ncbi:hypothetical protein AVEN_31619-1 [Araneus ventricosus]|uniref:PiggyBac transposable element-derived protein domain-containing protein n=1 Tax=Araneus ventricosus TaxID=182803 RepID=A0A4Y2JF46_ARAVE|nr:hypothetical protein AVEN_31619-1 [Araneus ventricosus]
MSTPSEKEIEPLSKLLPEVETDEDLDFENEVNGPKDVLEENFSDHESFSEHDTESLKDGDSGNEEVNTPYYKSISRTRYHNIVSRLPGTKQPAKDMTSPVKSRDLFMNDNVVQLIVECTNILIEKCAPNFSRESDARKKD